MFRGLGRGERITRQGGIVEELKRPLLTILWLCVFSTIEFMLLLADAIIVGPMIGVWVVAGTILLFYAVIMKRTRGVRNYNKQMAISILFIVALAIWGFIGEKWLDESWIPIRLPWAGWLKFTVEAISLSLKIVLGWGIWRLWIELVDPSGPTAPRQAILRDGPVLPWDDETYGGQLEPQESPSITHRFLDIKVSSDKGKERRCSAIPDTINWWRYAQAISGGEKFAEKKAARYGIRATEFNTVRDELMSNERNWLTWKSPDRKQNGIEVTPDGMAVFVGIAEMDMPER